jgi:catechol 2,3-dioxygenase
LAWFSIEAGDGAAFDATVARLRAADVPVTATDGGIATADPWGTRIRLVKS